MIVFIICCLRHGSRGIQQIQTWVVLKEVWEPLIYRMEMCNCWEIDLLVEHFAGRFSCCALVAHCHCAEIVKEM